MKNGRLLALVVLFLLLSAPCSWLGISQEKENPEFKMAVGLYNDGMYDLAVEQFKNFIELYPNTPQGIEARYYLGLTQLKLKRYDEARQTFQNFAITYGDHPKAPEAWLKVGDAFLALGNEREAASAYERLKVFHPKSQLVPEALLKAGELYHRLGERENAKKSYRTIIQDYPTSSVVLWARLGVSALYAEEGNLDLAEREARRVVESDASAEVKADALLTLGRLQAESALFDDAEATFTSITTKYKDSPAAPHAVFELGKLEMSAHSFSSAIEYFRRILTDKTADDSLQAEAMFEIGSAYTHLRRKDGAQEREFGKAQQSFEQLLSQFPSSRFFEQATLNAGRAALLASNAKDALRIIGSTLATPSSPIRALGLLLGGDAATALNQVNDAARYYSLFVDEFPDHSETPLALQKLARLYEERLHDYPKAISVYDRIAQKFSQTQHAVEALFARAVCEEKSTDYASALASYKNLQGFYPAHDRYDEVDRRIEFLKNHKVTNRDAGVEKLARLVGEMLTEEPKAKLAYRLGEIYFTDLRDYRAAAQQFTAAIDNGLAESEFADASFYRARAYDLLSESDSNAVSQAILYYESFLKQFPENRWSDDAAHRAFRLRTQAADPTVVFAQAKDFIASHTNSSHMDGVLFDLGTVALSVGDTVESLVSFERVASEFLQSSLRTRALLKRGGIYLARHQTDSALACWQQAAAIPAMDPTFVETLWNLADLHWRNRNITAAISLWQRISTEFPYSSFAEKSLALMPQGYAANGEYDAAITYYTQVLDDQQTTVTGATDSLEVVFRLADAYDEKGDRQNATRFFRRYLHSDRNGTHAGEAFAALGRIARAQQKMELAAAYFRQAAAVGGAGATSREIADLLFQTEQYADAARQYTQLAASTDTLTSRQMYQSRAIVATLRMDRLADAERLTSEFNKTYERTDTYQSEFEYERGMYFYRKQDYVNARKAFEKIVDDYETTRFGPWGHFYLGKIQEVYGKLDEAAKKYNEVIDKFPSSDVIPRVLLSLGNMHFTAERYDQAIKHYQEIVRLPELAGDVLPFAMNNLIEAYEMMKVYDAALKLTREYIDRYPNDESIIDKKIKVGTLYTRSGYYDQAVQYLQNLIGEAGSLLEAEIRYDIGEAYYNKGDYQQAVLEFLKVPYLVTRQGKVNWTATALYMAGQSYEKMSRFDDAISMYQQVIDRTGIDATFKAAAQKEIDRVKSVIKKDSK